MKRNFDPSQWTYHSLKNDGGKVSCLIPVEEKQISLDLSVRCQKDVDLNVVTGDGETILLERGPIVGYRGKLTDCNAVEIVADTGFWYLCRKSCGWFEKVDPTPMVVALEYTEKDAIAAMVDERLKHYLRTQAMEKELSEEEKDNLVLDIAYGDLDFTEGPDQFGLGYEERLAEFNQRIAEQSKTAEEPAKTPSPRAEEPAVKPTPSSST